MNPLLPNIRNVCISDAERIVDIYNYYIRETLVTFEEKEIAVLEMEKRIEKVLVQNYPFIVLELENQVIAYAYLDKWRSRPAYNITLETSIYMDNNFGKNGLGSILYKELIERAKRINIHSLIGVISLPNEASQKLHQKLGFELIGNFKESGLKFGKLIDVEFWQLFL